MTVSPYTDHVLSVACPVCGAHPQMRCTMPAGHTKPSPHTQRMWDANGARFQDKSWVTDDLRTDLLPLSVRAANCLRHNGLHTVRQVREVTDQRLLRFPNMGQKSLQEIRNLVGYAPGNGPIVEKRRRPWGLYANEEPERQMYGPFKSQQDAETWARAVLEPAGIRWFGAPLRKVGPLASVQPVARSS